MDKSRILVVDDDSKLTHLVELFLEKTKRYHVRVVNRPRDAVATAHEFQPQMILLDVDMPGLDGGEVARLMRADPILEQLPILFFTSLVSAGEAGGKLSKRGGDYFLAKPVDPVALVRCVDAVLAGTPELAA